MPLLRFKSIGFIAIFLLSCPLNIWAQDTDFIEIRPKQNSPLSRFGLGDRLDPHFAAQSGMGGLQSVYQDFNHLNLNNPAALASLQTTSFEVGLYGRVGSLEDPNGSANIESGNLRYLALGFPLRNPINLSLDRQENSWNAGMAFSLSQTTLVGYDLELEDDSDPDLGVTSNLLKGNGGTYQASWSAAYRRRGLSLGLSVNYNFGELSNSRVVLFDSISNALATEQLQEFNVSGANFGFGLQYAYYFKSPNDQGIRVPNGKRLLLGVNGKLQSDINTNATNLFRRFSPTNGIFVSDTLRNESNQAGKLTLPTEITVGLAYEEINKLFIGAEFGTTSWSNYSNDAQPGDILENTNRIAFGIQYIPNANAYRGWLKRLRYRAGLRLEDDPRVLNGIQGRRNAVTFGLGIPIVMPRQQVSFLNLAVEMGKFGVPDVIDANYVQFTLGFSLNDNTWFYKRKFN